MIQTETRRCALIFLMLVCGSQLFAQDKNVLADSVSKVTILQEVVVSASRTSEKLLAAPVSISKLANTQIQQSASPSFFDAIGNMKGVQMIVPSLGFKVLNTRGFSNTTNVRFAQLIDNVDNQTPHIGAPIGDALSPGNPLNGAVAERRLDANREPTKSQESR